MASFLILKIIVQADSVRQCLDKIYLWVYIHNIIIKLRRGGEIMPNRDGTGPEGKGPKTGRGMGNCAGSNKTNVARPRLGLGPRNGQGRRENQNS